MPTLAELEEENEKKTTEVSIAEKAALIKEAKRRYGGDWKRFFSGVSGFKSGIDWQAVKFKLS